MVISNRLKQTKYRRRTKNRRQTKHGRHRQYGGVIMRYGDYSVVFGVTSENLVMPGYPAIVSMISLYSEKDNLKSLLDTGIKDRVANLIKYEECKLPDETTPDDSIIVLKKKKKILRLNFATSIDCDDDIYVQLASHNFRIFIQEILQWNPFLNYSPTKTKIVNAWQGNVPSYDGLPIFNSEEWWNSQPWWIGYKQTLPVSSPPPPPPDESPHSAPPSLVTIESLQAEIASLKGQLEDYSRTLSDNIRLSKTIYIYRAVLVQNKIQLPYVPI